MALKLWRQAELFTNESLPHRISRCHPASLRTGAASFKRVLGSMTSASRRKLEVRVQLRPHHPKRERRRQGGRIKRNYQHKAIWFLVWPKVQGNPKRPMILTCRSV